MKSMLLPMVVFYAIGGVGVGTFLTESPRYDETSWYERDESVDRLIKKELVYVPRGDFSEIVRMYNAEHCLTWRTTTTGVEWYGEFSNGWFPCRHNENCTGGVREYKWQAPTSSGAVIEVRVVRPLYGHCPSPV